MVIAMKWFNRVVWFMPQMMATISALILFVCFILFFSWLLSQENYAVGKLIDLQVDALNKQALLQLEVPLPTLLIDQEVPKKYVLVPNYVNESFQIGRQWILAQGSLKRIGQSHVLIAHNIKSISLHHWMANLISMQHKIMSQPLLSIVLGCLLIVAGEFMGRLFAAVGLALITGFMIWHGLHIANLQQAIELDEYSIYPLVALGVITSAAIVFRSDLFSTHKFALTYAIDRIACLIVMFWYMLDIIGFFAWPEQLASVSLILLALFSPTLTYGVLGSYFIAIGLNADPAIQNLILSIALLMVFIVRAQHMPMLDHTRMIRHKFADTRNGLIPFHKLMGS